MAKRKPKPKPVQPKGFRKSGNIQTRQWTAIEQQRKNKEK